MVELGEFSGCLIAQQGWNFVRSVDQSDRPRRLQSCNLFLFLTPSLGLHKHWHWSVDTALACLLGESVCVTVRYWWILILNLIYTWMETRHVASSRCISQTPGWPTDLNDYQHREVSWNVFLCQIWPLIRNKNLFTVLVFDKILE